VLHKGGTTEEEPAAEIDAKAIKMSVGCIRHKKSSFLPLTEFPNLFAK
jgi:hypothetical protein